MRARFWNRATLGGVFSHAALGCAVALAGLATYARAQFLAAADSPLSATVTVSTTSADSGQAGSPQAHSASLGQAVSTSSPQAVSTTETRKGDVFEVRLNLSVKPGAHVFRNKTLFTWSRVEGAILRDVAYPTGVMIDDLLSDTPGAKTEAYDRDSVVTARFAATGEPGSEIRIEGKARYQGCTERFCYPPVELPFAVTAKIVGGQPMRESAAGGAAWRGFWGWTLFYFIAGIGLSLTPCVYPIIPITIAVLGGRGRKSPGQALAASLAYVFALSLVYALLGVAVAALGGVVRSFVQSIWVMGPIAALFVVFALAMFDVFTIQTPSAVGGRLQSLTVGETNLAGVFAMGMVAGLVAGPCIAAPLAALLSNIALTGDYVSGFFWMFSVGLGMGVVLAVAGVFAGVLPKAGGWMENVKKLFGFLMLGAAAYFLKPFAGDEAFLIAVSVILVAAALYLGLLDPPAAAAPRDSWVVPRDSPSDESRSTSHEPRLTTHEPRTTPHEPRATNHEPRTTQFKIGGWARMRQMLGIFCLFFAAALFLKGAATYLGLAPGGTAALVSQQPSPSAATSEPGAAGQTEGPFHFATAAELDALIARGDKPIILDFWAVWCAECKVLERNTLSKPEVAAALQGFHALRIDFDKEPALVKRYKILGPPTTIFISRGGKTLDKLRYDGADISAAEYVRRLESARKADWPA